MSEKSLSHCQGKGSLTHNNRTFVAKNVDKSRIRDNITFVNKPIDEVYHEIFKDSKITGLEQTIALKDKEIEEKEQRISFWQRLYSTGIEVGQYICKIFRLRYDFEKCVDKRNEGYRLNYIFGDDERTR